ncbi:hypothetical protein AVEN_122569-1 [Araneus ventricosus]|uniref:Uncharacterized protein n=1 Tax=Araneus ventricosus TaxID=182803 RepID=A0A4Y2URT6_ARAVE|nr:hypothetical protein AVEN_270436-1 [Araneus ventricosus]GBO15443.1 hypothetical protein AVEN_275518-1 [Araneus ventricosus]GBO15448.1 hypothetical protein AVEN_91650-1 [Araneus ventricosus]GBO15450.1 hypothetical protein AVEN_122569-1 [Araneus ventricosus]
MSGINVEESLTADDDLMFFYRSWIWMGEDILSEITDGMENDDKEDDDDTDPSQSLLTSPGTSSISSVPTPSPFFPSLSSTNDHFHAFDSMQTLLVDLTV